MKKLSLVLLSLVLIGFAGSAIAAKNAKDVLHCGCVLDQYGVEGHGMVYHEISISGNSKGHAKNHVNGSTSFCFTGDYEITEPYAPIEEEWMRTGPDCELSDVDDLANCDTLEPVPSEGLDCGDIAILAP